MVKVCVSKAEADNNIARRDGSPRLRIQLLCDAVGVFRGGRMGTRFDVRLVDLQRFHNAPYYFLNSAMYLRGDKFDELTRYLRSTFAVFNAGFTRRLTGKRDEKGAQE
eukprot:3341714-Pleurochrysis_carterae.AAC.3